MRNPIAVEKNINSNRYGFTFIMLVVIMTGTGMAVLYSGSLHYAERFFNDASYFVVRQFRNLIVGSLGLVFFSLFSFDRLRKLLPYLVIAGFLFLLLPFIPGISAPRNGAHRWITIGGLSLQPSEFIKLLLIIFLANFFDKKNDTLDASFISIAPPFFITAIFVTLVYLENDFSSSFFLMLIFMIMFFIAGGPLLWFLKGLLVTIPCAILMVITSTYRMKRVLSFISPDSDPLDTSYQINAALEALSSGGLYGMGIGNGIHKISSVPEIYSDFIFVAWAEEMGFLGVCGYLMLLLAFAIVAYLIALNCNNRFGCYVAFSAASALILQSFLNLAVVVHLLPTTGIPLPFFSFGGSSLITSLCLCGLIINVSHYSKRSVLHA